MCSVPGWADHIVGARASPAHIFPPQLRYFDSAPSCRLEVELKEPI